MRIIAVLIIVLSSMTASSAFSAEVSMHGLIQTWLASGSQASGTSEPENQFILRRARVGINMEVNEVISGKFQTDGVDLAETIDAEVDLNFHPLVKIRAGRMKYDFDIQGRTSAKALAFPTRPIPTNALAGLMDPGPGVFRMEGVELIGNSPTLGLGYALGVFNGLSVTTDEDKPAFLVNLYAKPMNQLTLNAGYMKEDNSVPYSYIARTVGLLYVRDGIIFGAEYYAAEIGTAASTVDPSGYYAYLTYRWGDFEAGGRYQSYDTDVATVGEISSIDLKLSYYLGEGKGYKAPKITLLAEIRDADAGYASITDPDLPHTRVGALTFDEDGTPTRGDDVDNVFILELSIPL